MDGIIKKDDYVEVNMDSTSDINNTKGVNVKAN